jgi:HEAT repeat protein/outer membrane protein assembly factor BamE (lipoprotein component of BamABCDE complex)
MRIVLMVIVLAMLNGLAGGVANAQEGTQGRKSPFRDELLTGENYAKIQNGMTAAEVKEILGPARSSSSSGGSHDTSMTWRPRNDTKHHVEVHFKDGKVVSKATNMDFAAMAAKAMEKGLKGNFEMLHPGMSEQEVTAIMGQPTKTDRASAGRSGFTWLAGEKFAFVVFQDGKATEMDCSEMPPRNREITQANYQRIHLGMTLGEVQGVFGEAEEKQEDSGSERYTWREGKKTLMVVMRGGKMTAKTSTVKNTPLVQFEKTEEDRFGAALANLSSMNKDQQLKALEFLRNEPFDPAKAEEVSKALNRPLVSKDAAVAKDAAHTALKWATQENSAHFLRIIERPVGKSVGDKNREGIPQALEILAKIREPAAVPHMCRLLRDFFLRDDAANSLRKMGPELAEKELQKYVNDQNPDTRKGAGEVLEEFQDGGGFRMKTALGELKSPSQNLRSLAAQQIGRMYVHPKRKQEVARALEPLLKDSDANVAMFAAKALARWGGVENEAALIAALSAKSPEVRLEAAGALREMGTSKSLGELEKLSEDTDKRVALAAKEAVIGIKTRKG